MDLEKSQCISKQLFTVLNQYSWVFPLSVNHTCDSFCLNTLFIAESYHITCFENFLLHYFGTCTKHKDEQQTANGSGSKGSSMIYHLHRERLGFIFHQQYSEGKLQYPKSRLKKCFLIFMCIGESYENTYANSVGPGWDPQFCICNKILDDAGTAGPCMARLESLNILIWQHTIYFSVFGPKWSFWTKDLPLRPVFLSWTNCLTWALYTRVTRHFQSMKRNVDITSYPWFLCCKIYKLPYGINK